ncbi:MAG: SH3 domain-containing protein [Rickettsiales bacterium]
MLKVQKNVIGELMECDVNWCRIQVESYKAWTLKSHIWGIYEREVL